MIKVTILPYVHQSAYLSGMFASDYQIDMVYHGMMSLEDVQVQQLPENPLMFKACPKEWKEQSWGKAFTLYGLLDGNKGVFPVEDSDLIICCLHHTLYRDKERFHTAIKYCKDSFPKSKVIVVDGHDFTDYSEETAALCPYFKRELTDDRTSALPIFFGIPEEKLSTTADIKKIRDFSEMVPANFNWNTEWTNNYHKWDNEEDYYQQYRESYFGLNSCKGGWQTGRLQEICAQDCLPYWTDLEVMPKNIYHNLNRELLQEVKRLPGVNIDVIDSTLKTYDARNIRFSKKPAWIDWCKFDLNKYESLRKELKEHCRKAMTTKALAKYILERSL